MRIFLTGSTGFLGNNVLRMLLDDGHEVIVSTRHSSDPRPLKGLNVEIMEMDLGDHSAVARAIDQVDLVIHSAALIHLGWTRLEESRRINVESTRLLAEQCRRKSIRMIHVSTVDALSPSTADGFNDESCVQVSKIPCAYVVSKREADTVFLDQVERGLDGVIAVPSFMLGPWDWKPSSGQMIMAVEKGIANFAPAGGFSVADVRDVACGILSAIAHGRSGERYILAGENMTYLDLWNRIAKTLGRRKPFGAVPGWLNWMAGQTGDLIGKVSGTEPVVNSAATAMGTLHHWYSSDKANRELGYQIGPVETAIADAFEWFQQYGYIRRRKNRSA